MADTALAVIDATLESRCACGCGRQLDPNGPSGWWATEWCQKRGSRLLTGADCEPDIVGRSLRAAPAGVTVTMDFAAIDFTVPPWSLADAFMTPNRLNEELNEAFVAGRILLLGVTGEDFDTLRRDTLVRVAAAFDVPVELLGPRPTVAARRRARLRMLRRKFNTWGRGVDRGAGGGIMKERTGAHSGTYEWRSVSTSTDGG